MLVQDIVVLGRVLWELPSRRLHCPGTTAHCEVNLIERNASVSRKRPLGWSQSRRRTEPLTSQKVAAWGLGLGMRSYLAPALPPWNPLV